MSDYLDRLDQWVHLHQGQLRAVGRVHFSKSPSDERANHSAHFVLFHEFDEVELLLWESGEAEFSYGPPAAAKLEHHDLGSLEHLDGLLARLCEHVLPLGAGSNPSPE